MVTDSMRLFNARKLPKIILAAASCYDFKIPRYAGDLRKYLDTGDLELTAALKSLFSEDASLYTKAVTSGIECGVFETTGHDKFIILEKKGKDALSRYLEKDPGFLDLYPLIKRHLDHGSNIHQKQIEKQKLLEDYELYLEECTEIDKEINQKQLTKEDQQKKVDIPSSYIGLSEKDKNIFLAILFFGSLPYNQDDLQNVKIDRYNSDVDKIIKSKLMEIDKERYKLIIDKGIEKNRLKLEDNKVEMTKKGRIGFNSYLGRNADWKKSHPELEKQLYFQKILNTIPKQKCKHKYYGEQKKEIFTYKRLSKKEEGIFLIASFGSVPLNLEDIDKTPHDGDIESKLSRIENYEEIIRNALESGYLEEKNNQAIFTDKGKKAFSIHVGRNPDCLNFYTELKKQFLDRKKNKGKWDRKISLRYGKLLEKEKYPLSILLICESIPSTYNDIENSPLPEKIKSILKKAENYDEIIKKGIETNRLEKKDGEVKFTVEGKSGFKIHLGINKKYSEIHHKLEEELYFNREKNTKERKIYNSLFENYFDSKTKGRCVLCAIFFGADVENKLDSELYRDIINAGKELGLIKEEKGNVLQLTREGEKHVKNYLKKELKNTIIRNHPELLEKTLFEEGLDKIIF